MISYRKTLLCALFFLSLRLLTADQVRYDFPQNLGMKLVKSSHQTAGKIRLNAEIQSLIGDLQRIEVDFSSSTDLKILNNGETIELLEQGKSKNFEVVAISDPEKKNAGEIGSWIRMKVRYLPDYAEIKNALADRKTYPDDNQRLRLIEILEKNRKLQSLYQDTVRCFLER